MIPALLLAASLSAAPSVPALLVSVRPPPGVGFNVRGPSLITVQAGTYRQQFPLTGVPDPTYPDAFRAVRPVTVRLPARLRGPVTLRARLFLCDRVSGVCTLQEHTRRVTLKAGTTVPVVLQLPAKR
ncbi:hypothetical protein [Deinococcus depolymerans]|uniref:Thiol:disulfide interchange protein DsbD N-terminal domain-containing protein n=1 Tax=Deinococcus depolymerans TaxID=392408 RepID=A0ABP3MG11_9DEIO